MDGLLRTLIRSRNAAPSPNRGGRNRSRYGDKRNGGGENHHGQMEVILEALARGLVEYAVQKYMKKLGGGGGGDDDDKDGRHHNDRRLSTRGNRNRDDDERARGGVPNMDMDMLEHLSKNILFKAVDRFGGGGGGGADEQDERQEMRASAKSRGRGRDRAYSQDRYAHSRERSQDQDRSPQRSHRRGHREGGGGDSGSKDQDRERRRRRHSPRDGYSSPSRHRRGDDDNDDDDDAAAAYRRRRRHGTDYGPLVESLETLSDTIASLNERQPGHANCEFYEAFADRSGKTQDAIGAVLTRLREREARRQERRGRRRS